MNPKDQIKQTLSILDVVSTYIRLERAGSQYKGRCPFHNEKTPSFFVSTDRGSYHCFGCGEHGDIFTFVEKMESVPFYEALMILADRAGVQLSSFRKEEKEKETHLITILSKASKHYINNLENSIEAKKYLGERGLTDDTIKKFNIGFSLGNREGWVDIFSFLNKEGYTKEEMIGSGLVIKKENEDRYFDRFRGRVMFPIKNTFGNVVGFSGRILPLLENEKTAKYINSPETEVYHKSKILYGYDLAKKSIADKKEVILVEGPMDLIMSHQVGVENIVATSGTAITEDQIKILKRFSDKVLLSFDQDSAGDAAMKKCALLSLYGGLDVFVIPKKEDVKDIADLIINFGGEVWEDLISKREHLIEYITNDIFSKISETRERGQEIRKEVFPFLRALESDIDRAYFIKYLANKLEVEESNIVNDLKKIKIEKEDNKEQKKNTNSISKKEMFLRRVLAILDWKKIDEEKFLNKYLNNEEIFTKEYLEFKKNIPFEFLEKEIILLEKEISKNKTYLENSKKFIDKYLSDFVINFKIEILSEEREKNKEDLVKNSLLSKEILKLKNLLK